MKLLTLLWKIWAIILQLITILLLAPIILILSVFNVHYKYIYGILRVWAIVNFYGVGMRLTFEAALELEEEKYMIIANHTSIMDVMLMFILHKNHPLTFVGKKEIVKIPLLGNVYKKVVVMVDRDSLYSRARVYERVSEKIKEGESVVIFPEGGVTETDEEILLPFKKGAFVIAKNAEMPIVVYSIQGLKKAFPFDFWKGYPTRVIVIREKVYTKEEVFQKSYKELMTESREILLNRLQK